MASDIHYCCNLTCPNGRKSWDGKWIPAAITTYAIKDNYHCSFYCYDFMTEQSKLTSDSEVLVPAE